MYSGDEINAALSKVKASKREVPTPSGAQSLMSTTSSKKQRVRPVVEAREIDSGVLAIADVGDEDESCECSFEELCDDGASSVSVCGSVHVDNDGGHCADEVVEKSRNSVQPPSYWLQICIPLRVLRGSDIGHFEKQVDCARSCVGRPGVFPIFAGHIDMQINRTQSCVDLRYFLQAVEGALGEWDKLHAFVRRCSLLKDDFTCLLVNKQILGVCLMMVVAEISASCNGDSPMSDTEISSLLHVLDPFSVAVVKGLGGG